MNKQNKEHKVITDVPFYYIIGTAKYNNEIQELRQKI